MLSFEYEMELDFGNRSNEGFSSRPKDKTRTETEAVEHAFSLRCFPQESVVQHVLETQVRLEPSTDLCYGIDAFGNRYCYGLIHSNHNVFRVQMKGKACRFPDLHEDADRTQQMMFRYPSALTKPGKIIKQWYDQNICMQGSDGLALSYRIRDLIHQKMTYSPGTTTSTFTAEEAASLGQGVCQDYAHIMLSLCRMAGIPARYTAGILLGEGRSHAWVEICYNGQWWSMDPTNPDVEWDQQIIFSHGRDARDCEINRGVYIGPSAQMQFVTAAVVWEPMDKAEYEQLQ